MSLFIPQESELTMLRKILLSENYALRLFTNNHTPVEGDTVADYTEMATQNYAEKVLVATETAGTWTFTSGTPGSASYQLQQWIFDGVGGLVQVYGYYLVGETTGLLLGADKFTDGPYPVARPNDEIRVAINLGLD